jgi:aconitate hydratase
MLGEPIEFLAPDVTGVHLTGRLPEGITPTDLTLTVVQLLRKLGVVDQFVEFCGPGLDELSLADRAMLANMTPETGATMLYFPVDGLTLEYLRFTGRNPGMVKAYMQAQGLFRQPDSPQPEFTRLVELDLSSVEPSLAGPKHPQDRVALKNVKTSFHKALGAPRSENGYALNPQQLQSQAVYALSGEKLGHGAVVVASITSCTNTSNPAVMLAAGLLAKKAVERGLKSKPWVKTSLAPGSRVVAEYLTKAGVMPALEALGFHLVGFGCTTCIGNSGPLAEDVVNAIRTGDLVAAAVLSGNRNFEGRVSPHTRANYLASPPLVVAYALAGTVDIDLEHDPLGTDRDGQPVYLKNIWPSSSEIMAAIQSSLQPEMFERVYASVFEGSRMWNNIQSGKQPLYAWNQHSSYLHEPPFFAVSAQPAQPIRAARALAWLGDSVTTDHISPAGSIKVDSPAGKYLLEFCEESPEEFNSYGARRGNDQVMVRGTFANIRLKNNLLPGVEGAFTRYLPTGEQMTIYDAAMRYQQEDIPLVVLAGKEYGTGSSRDWAAKGVLLLGVKAIIAESYERIHRSNLAGMGVLPLQFMPGENTGSLGLDGSEVFDIEIHPESLMPGAMVQARARRGSKTIDFKARVRLDTIREVDYYRQGGLLKAAVGWLTAAEK